MTCPTPTYPTEGAAWNALRNRADQLPYPCADHWHVAPVAEAMVKRRRGRG